MQELRNDITKIRAVNEEMIKTALKTLGSSTKARIAAETGISVVTCGKILEDLRARGEILEDSVSQTGLGRPAMTYAFNANHTNIAALYVELDHDNIFMATVVTNLLGEIIEEKRDDHYERMNYEEIEKALTDLIQRYPSINIISIGVPGYITNGVIGLCNFVDLMGLPLQSMLREKFPSIKILVENDMNCCAFGFYSSECPNSDTTIAMIYSPAVSDTVYQRKSAPVPPKSDGAQKLQIDIGINYGAGFVSDGHILRGFSGFAGEVAFLPGISPELEDSFDTRVLTIAHIINCIVPILNPEIIALTGGQFDENLVENVKACCLMQVAPQHMPKITLRPNVHKEYINGLISLALEETTNNIMLIKKTV